MKLLAHVHRWVMAHKDSGLLNRYVIASLVFLVWLTCFDSHNLVVQYKLYSSVRQLQRSKEEYAVKLQEVLAEREILQTQTERYARERYFMHRPDEEVFIVKRK